MILLGAAPGFRLCKCVPPEKHVLKQLDGTPPALGRASEFSVGEMKPSVAAMENPCWDAHVCTFHSVDYFSFLFQ